MNPDETASEMFNIWVDNTELNLFGELCVNDATLREMAELFGNLKEDQRYDCFIKFISILEEEGYEYDRNQFHYETSIN